MDKENSYQEKFRLQELLDRQDGLYSILSIDPQLSSGRNRAMISSEYKDLLNPVVNGDKNEKNKDLNIFRKYIASFFKKNEETHLTTPVIFEKVLDYLAIQVAKEKGERPFSELTLEEQNEVLGKEFLLLENLLKENSSDNSRDLDKMLKRFIEEYRLIDRNLILSRKLLGINSNFLYKSNFLKEFLCFKLGKSISRKPVLEKGDLDIELRKLLVVLKRNEISVERYLDIYQEAVNLLEIKNETKSFLLDYRVDFKERVFKLTEIIEGKLVRL